MLPIAARLAADGAQVIISDLPGEALDAKGKKLGLPTIAADLGDPASVKEMNLPDRNRPWRTRHFW